MLDTRQRGLLANSALLGAGTAVLATAIGAPLGLALARISLPRKGLLRLALAAPVLLPPYIVGLAWTYLGSGSGWLARVVGADLISLWTYSLPAAILVLSLVFYPVSMLATEVALRQIDGRLEEAALVVASPARVLGRITLPLALPSVLAATLLIFVLAVSEFGVPGLLRVRVYTTEVFTAFAALYDFTRAILLTVPLLVLCLAVASVAALMGGRLLVTRRSAGVRPLMFDAWRQPATAGAIAVLAIGLVLPLAILVGEALGARSLSTVFAGSGEAISNSLVLATAGATVVVIVAAVLGYGRTRVGARIGGIADVLFVVLFAVPSTIVGDRFDQSVESTGPAGHGLRDRRDAASGIFGAVPSGRSARGRRERPLCAYLARGGCRGQRCRMVSHDVAHRPAADAHGSGCSVGHRVRSGIRRARREHSRGAAW